MEHIRTLLFAALALSIAMVVVFYPTQLFEIVAAAVIILSTASTLVFFGFVLRTAFRSLNERTRAQRAPVKPPAPAQAQAPAPAAGEQPGTPMAPIKPS